jgi:hypothetical protein
MLDWLPGLLLLSDFGGDWSRYQEALYQSFRRDFMGDPFLYRGLRVGLKRHPLIKGKEATFWHFISEGSVEEDRLPDLRRCERIRWPRVVIENAQSPDILQWNNERRGETRTCLWVQEVEYLVVLAVREGYVLPWTAYLVCQSHQKRKLEREYRASLKG